MTPSSLYSANEWVLFVWKGIHPSSREKKPNETAVAAAAARIVGCTHNKNNYMYTNSKQARIAHHCERSSHSTQLSQRIRRLNGEERTRFLPDLRNTGGCCLDRRRNIVREGQFGRNGRVFEQHLDGVFLFSLLLLRFTELFLMCAHSSLRIMLLLLLTPTTETTFSPLFRFILCK